MRLFNFLKILFVEIIAPTIKKTMQLQRPYLVESHSRWEDAKLGTCENVSDTYKTPLVMFGFSRYLLVYVRQISRLSINSPR
jgi:hypothetical protein